MSVWRVWGRVRSHFLSSHPLQIKNPNLFIFSQHEIFAAHSLCAAWMNSSGIIPPAWCFSSEDKPITSPQAFLEPSITSLFVMRWATKQREQSCVESWSGSKNICVCHCGTLGFEADDEQWFPLCGSSIQTAFTATEAAPIRWLNFTSFFSQLSEDIGGIYFPLRSLETKQK